MSNTERPDVPVFDLPIEVVVKAMHKISGRSWCILGFSHTLCGKEISSPQLQIWVGQNQNLTTQQWDSLHLPTPPHDSWVHSNGTYYRPISDSDCHFQAGTRECCLPEYPESTIRVSTVVVTGINARQAMVEPSTLPWFTHTLDISNSCAMTPGGQSQSSQQFDSDTVHLPTTPTLTDLLQDLVRDLHYAHLRTQAYNMNRVFVEPPRDGMQSCLYHIFGAFVGQPMSQVRRSLGTWYLQPVNQATLCDFLLPTDLQSPPACVQRSRSGVDPSNLADECNVHSLGLLFDISFQILSSSTSVQVINIHGTRGMIIGHVNSTRVKHFIVTKLLRNTGNVSSTVKLYPMEVPAVHQNVTQNKRRKVNVPPDPTVQLNTWHNGPPHRVALGIGTSFSYQSVLLPHALPHTDSCRVPVPWVVGSLSPGLATFNNRPSDEPPGLDLGSTQVPSVQGEQGTDVMESDKIQLGHITDDLIDTWPDGPPAGVAFGIGGSLSYQSVLPPDSLPHTDSRRVTFTGVVLWSPQGQGGPNAVSTPLHASPTPGPPGSIPTHLVTVGPVPHASASVWSGLPTFGRPDYNATAPVDIPNDRS